MSEPYRELSPVELVQDFAEGFIFSREFNEHALSERERLATAQCNKAMLQFNMLGGYQVETNNAFVVEEKPKLDEEGKVTFHHLEYETSFRGFLIGQRILKIAELGDEAVRAACLTFKNAIIQTRSTEKHKNVVFLETIEGPERLYVPAFAVKAMSRVTTLGSASMN